MFRVLFMIYTTGLSWNVQCLDNPGFPWRQTATVQIRNVRKTSGYHSILRRLHSNVLTRQAITKVQFL